MKSIALLFLLLSPLTNYASEGEAPPKNYEGKGHPVIDLKKPNLTDSDENSSWRMWYIAKGTRSEGLHGAILNKDEFVHGTKIGEKKLVVGKTYFWCGTWDSRENLFSLSGWLPESSNRVRLWISNTNKAEQGGAQ